MSAATWITASLLTLASSVGSACESVRFDALPFTVCHVDPTREDVRLWLDDSAGQKLGTFRRLEDHLDAEGRTLMLAMNAGMYHPDRRPVGLYIEDGEVRQPLVTRAGPGNFGLLPNGVLCLKEAEASVIESRAFAENDPSCTFATQSGPMLVIDGALHPRFIPDGQSTNIRNGVGVAEDGSLILAISDAPVNFDTFGRLFRDHLKTPNALYLDGRVSRLFAPSIGRADGGFPIGPILGVSRSAD